MPSLQSVAAHAKKYGFIFPSSEIYGSLKAVYDYGPLGYLLKENIRKSWEQAMWHSDGSIRVVPMDASILMHSGVWKASGHLDLFDDVFTDNKDSNKRYRVDELVEAAVRSWREQGQDAKAEALMVDWHGVQKAAPKEMTAQCDALLQRHGVVCPVSKTAHWTPTKRLHLMFGTQAGAADEDRLYLRPETAQGIYTNFLNIQQSMRLHLPFGVSQVGKAFRNELITKQFVLRTREFEQMEMQWFVSPQDATDWLHYWKQMRMAWYVQLGFDPKRLAFVHHAHLAHYAQEAYDIEYAFPFGNKEVEGIHHRGSYDLTQHQTHAGKNLQCFDLTTQKQVLPQVVETSAGLNRLCLACLFEAWREEESIDGQPGRMWLALPAALAPIHVGVFPLVKKDGLADVAKEIADALSIDWQVIYETSGSIGKRYARQDAIGTPYCLTIDHQTQSDQTMTLRHRDSCEQQRVQLNQVQDLLRSTCSMHQVVKQLRTQSTLWHAQQ